MPHSIRQRLIVAACVLPALFLYAGAAVASPLISFTDTNPVTSAAAPLSDTLVAWAVSWTQTVATPNTTIEAWVRRFTSVTDTEFGQAYLMTSIGPGTTAASEVVAPVSFLAPHVLDISDLSLVAPVTLFTGVSLGPGTYYLVLGGPLSQLVNPLVNPYEWLGDFSSVVVNTAPGFALGSYSTAFGPGTLNPFEPNNVFTPGGGLNGMPFSFFFRLSDTADAAVPEPSTLALMLLGGAGVVRRKLGRYATRR